jgi:hypothetical protein
MAGIISQEKIQIGKESTHGTAVAATTILRGIGEMNDDRAIKRINERAGYYMPTGTLYNPFLAASFKWPSQELTFEQAGYVLNAGLLGVAPVRDGALKDPYISAYPVCTSGTATDIYTYTIEKGDNQRVDEMEYSFVKSFKLKGAPKSALMLEAEWIGRKVTDAEFTAGQTLPTVEPILFGMGVLSIDATGGTIGFTPVTTSWSGFELDVETGWEEVFTGDGRSDFVFHKYAGFSGKGKLILHHDAFGEAELGIARTKAVRLMRMQFTSPTAFSTPGDTYTYKTLRIDAAIQYTSVPTNDALDKNVTVPLEFEIIYGVADSQGPVFTLVNALSALP